MKKNRDRNIKAYMDFFAKFSARLQNKTFDKIDSKIPISKRLPGLFPLISSFSASALVKKSSIDQVEEWNPFHQRVFYRTYKEFKRPTLTTDFEQAIDVIDRFIEIAHESNHVLLIEPFFCGKMGKLSRAQFLQFFLYFEGYCFWYADIIVTRRLREKLADGEFVRNRSGVSQPSFHPYRAFKAMGFKDEKEILDIYLDAFNGERTVVFNQQDKTFVRDLFKRFTSFYLTNLRSLRLLHQQLIEIGIFDEFRKRFCNIPNLPSLLPNHIMEMKDRKDYCHEVFRRGLKYMDALSPDQILRVRHRRFIQSRAYIAFSLRNALETKNIFSNNGKTFDNKKILANLNLYITALESNLIKLAEGQSLSELQKMNLKNDRFYSKMIRKDLANADIWILRRKMIFPSHLKVPLGPLKQNAPLSEKDAAALTTAILAFCSKRFLNEFNPSKPITSVIKKTGELVKIVSNPKYYQNSKQRKYWIKVINSILLEPEILKKWSVALKAINPEKNQFREILFIYE